jgi:dTDP-4-amino-4,6-dideoxygalactose transaminase
LRQLQKLAGFQRRRRAVAAAYTAAFRDVEELQTPVERAEVEHAWHLYVLRLHPGAELTRDDLISELTARNIGASVHFIPIHLHPYYRDKYGYQPEDYPVAYDNYTRMLSLPLSPRLSDAQQARVIDTVLDSVMARQAPLRKAA